MIQQLPSSIKLWRDNREQFLNRQKECDKVFRESFGKSVLMQIEDYLGDREFDQAWDRLEEIYSATATGTDRANLINKIMNMIFNPYRATLEGFILEFTNLCDLAEDMTDIEKHTYLFSAINKGTKDHTGISTFQGTIDYCENSNQTFINSMKLLYTRNEKLKLERAEAKQRSYAYVVKNGTNKPKLKGKGNVNSDDWMKDKTCYHCGKKGHIKPKCPDLNIGNNVIIPDVDIDDVNMNVMQSDQPNLDLVKLFKSNVKVTRDGSHRTVRFKKSNAKKYMMVDEKSLGKRVRSDDMLKEETFDKILKNFYDSLSSKEKEPYNEEVRIKVSKTDNC